MALFAPAVVAFGAIETLALLQFGGRHERSSADPYELAELIEAGLLDPNTHHPTARGLALLSEVALA